MRDTEGTALRQRNIPSLTGVRGAAALWVFLYHATTWAFHVPVLRDGWMGVDLFFVLSGFMLMHVHAAEFAILSGRNLAAFAALRFFRIYPLTTVVLGLLAVAAIIFVPFSASANLAPSMLAKTLIIATRWWLPFSPSLNEPVWSVSVEIVGYAAFPFLAFMLVRIAMPLIAVAVAIIAFLLLAILSWHLGKYDVNDVFSFAYARMAGCFIAGMALSRARSMIPAAAAWQPAAVEIVAAVLIFSSCIVPVLKLLVPSAFGMLIFALSFQAGPVNIALASRPALFLGRISFPLYLVHATPIGWIWAFSIVHRSTALAIILMLALYAVFCVALSYALHIIIERPSHRLGHRLVAYIKSGEEQTADGTTRQTSVSATSLKS